MVTVGSSVVAPSGEGPWYVELGRPLALVLEGPAKSYDLGVFARLGGPPVIMGAVPPGVPGRERVAVFWADRFRKWLGRFLAALTAWESLSDRQQRKRVARRCRGQLDFRERRRVAGKGRTERPKSLAILVQSVAQGRPVEIDRDRLPENQEASAQRSQSSSLPRVVHDKKGE